MQSGLQSEVVERVAERGALSLAAVALEDLVTVRERVTARERVTVRVRGRGRAKGQGQGEGYRVGVRVRVSGSEDRRRQGSRAVLGVISIWGEKAILKRI